MKAICRAWVIALAGIGMPSLLAAQNPNECWSCGDDPFEPGPWVDCLAVPAGYDSCQVTSNETCDLQGPDCEGLSAGDFLLDADGSVHLAVRQDAGTIQVERPALGRAHVRACNEFVLARAFSEAEEARTRSEQLVIEI